MKHGLVFSLALVPALALGWRAISGDLGANPIETITHATGDWGLRWLLASLAITPLRRLSGWNGIVRMRRTLGLVAFGYICLHLVTFIVFDHFFDWLAIVEDIRKRPYITVGFAGFLCLVPLAITSTRGWIRRLGRNWQRLHRLVYVGAGCGVVHYFWLVKADTRAPAAYAVVLGVLLLSRVVLRSAER